MPYVYLLTRMKSPISRVGSIDPDGILNGSTRNERSRKTIRMTGKKLTGYSIHHGTRASAALRLRSQKRSIAVTTPVKTSSRNRNRAKFMRGSCDGERDPRRAASARPKFHLSLFVSHLQDRQERLLGNLDRAYLLHALLARL